MDAFPAECPAGSLTADERMRAFLIFDNAQCIGNDLLAPVH